METELINQYNFLADLLNKFHTAHPNIQALMLLAFTILCSAPFAVIGLFLSGFSWAYFKKPQKSALRDACFYSERTLKSLNAFKYNDAFAMDDHDYILELENLNSKSHNKICKLNKVLKDDN